MTGRVSKTVAALSLLLVPLLAWLAVKAKTNTDDVNNWIDKSSVAYSEYQQYCQRFGGDDEIVISWDGCSVSDPRLPLVSEALRRECPSALDRVVNGQEVLLEMRQSASRWSSNAARRRLRGSLFGYKLQTTCIVARLTESGRGELDQSIEKIVSVTCEQSGLQKQAIHLGGKAIHDHALNSLTNQALWWGIPGSILAATIAFWFIGNFRMAIGVLYVPAWSGLFSLALVPVCGVQVNGLLVLMPVLVFVLSLGCAVHMVKALQQTRMSEPGTDDSVILSSLARSRPPVILSLVTTAIAIGSLAISPIPAVFQFGVFSAASLLIALAMLIWVLPAAWMWTGIGSASRRPSPTNGFLTGGLVRLQKRAGVILLLSLTAIGSAAMGLKSFELDLDTRRLFSDRTVVAKDHDWLEQHLYPLGRIEFIVRFRRSIDTDRFRQLRKVQIIQTAISKDPAIHSAISTANLVKVPTSRTPFEKRLTERAVSAQLDHDYQKLHQSGMLQSDDEFDRWRITVACHTDRLDTERVIADRILNELARISPRPDENGDWTEISATGLALLATDGQQRLFDDLVKGLLTAILIIAPIIMIFLRSVRLGIIAMLVNLVPVVVVFGLLGRSGFHLDIGSILTATVGLGIAIDDTLHFLHYYRLGSYQEKATLSPVEHAIHQCAKAVLTTTAIICAGMCFFLASVFLPIRHFSLCLMLLLVVAALADLILLPAMLNVFDQRRLGNQG